MPENELKGVYEGVVFNPFDRLPNTKGDIRDNPLYIVEFFASSIVETLTTVNVYKISPESLKAYKKSNKEDIDVANLVKDYNFYIQEEHPFGEEAYTEIAKQAKKNYDKNPKTSYIHMDKPPIFSSFFVEDVDTVTGTQELGFVEKNPAKNVYSNDGKLTLVPSPPTGVFIGISNIHITRNYVPVESAMQHLQRNAEMLLGQSNPEMEYLGDI